MDKLSIITPTYNRAELLPRCFCSLLSQTSKCFEWIIIDDGSNDGTSELVQKWLTDSDNPFIIKYQYKNNGGKHSALNSSHSLVEGDYVLILDSDDYLTPDAAETVLKTWDEYRNDWSIAVVSFYKAHKDGRIVSKVLNTDRVISNHIDYRVNSISGGDQCEVVRAEYFLDFIFPTFSEEKFVSEGLLWNYLGFRYKTVYCNKSVYICEYQPEGISKSGKKLLMRNPKGMIALTKTFFDSRINWKKRIKETWLYIVYSLCDHRSLATIVKESGQSMLTISQLPAGFLLYIYWKKRYL